MKLLVFGSRGYKLTTDELHRTLIEMGIADSVTEIISGGADGPDSVGIDWARENERPYKVFYPDWANLGMRAGLVRNDSMVDYCDSGVAFWDGKSRGTQYTINKMNKKGKKLLVVTRS